MSDVSKVSASKPKAGGAVRVAPIGTTLPTDATTALNEALKSLGYLSEDGYTNNNSPETATTKAWCGDTVLSGETTKPDTFKFKMLETLNAEVQKVVYESSNVVVGSNGKLQTVYANSVEHTAKVWVIEEVLKGGVIARTVIPNGTITSISEITHKPGEPVGYEVEVTAMPDSSITNSDGVACNHVTYYS